MCCSVQEIIQVAITVGEKGDKGGTTNKVTFQTFVFRGYHVNRKTTIIETAGPPIMRCKPKKQRRGRKGG